MTTMQEDFEAWHISIGMDPKTCQFPFHVWQAAHLAGQRAMQERAARGCDGSMLTIVDSDWSKGYDQAIKDVSKGIRALEVKP